MEYHETLNFMRKKYECIFLHFSGNNEGKISLHCCVTSRFLDWFLVFSDHRIFNFQRFLGTRAAQIKKISLELSGEKLKFPLKCQGLEKIHLKAHVLAYFFPIFSTKKRSSISMLFVGLFIERKSIKSLIHTRAYQQKIKERNNINQGG